MILDTNLARVEVVAIDRDVAYAYGAVRLELKKAGTPIPIIDTWIAAIARHRGLPSSPAMFISTQSWELSGSRGRAGQRHQSPRV
jgi:hypothetical protein